MSTPHDSMKWRHEAASNPLSTNAVLYAATLDEFSKKSFHEASLNDILKNIRMNKGSFYYRFHDKMDLYLSLIEKIGRDKIAFFQSDNAPFVFPTDFYEQIRFMVENSIRFAKAEKRIYDFWKKFQQEEPTIRDMVKATFKELSDSAIDILIIEARKKGQFNSSYTEAFLISLIRAMITQIDSLITPELQDAEIFTTIDEFIRFLKNGLMP